MRWRASGASIHGMVGVALVAHIAAACAAPSIKLYPGPALPGSQIATLRADDSIAIKAVDGEKIPAGASDVELQLLPGRHQAQFGYTHEICYYLEVSRGRECRQFYYGDVVLKFEALPGHSYKIYAGSMMAGWRPYIQDRTSGVVVVRSETEWPL